MRLGRESLILVAVPVILLAGAWYVLMPAGDTVAPAVHADANGDAGNRGPDAASPDATAGVMTQPRVVDGSPPVGGGDDPGAARPAPGSADPDGRASGSGPARDRSAPAGERGSSPDARDGLRRRRPFRGRLVDASGRPITDGVILVRERRNLFDARGHPVHQDIVPFDVAIGADGGFEIPRRVGFVYTIHVQAGGFAPVASNLYATSSPLVTLSRPAEVSGQVVDAANGSPVRGAKIRVFTSSVPEVTETDANGAYSLPSLTPSPAWMEVLHRDYTVVRVQLGTLHAGATVTRNFSLVPGMSLSGRVVIHGSDAPPQEAVTVQAYDVYRQLHAGSVLTNAGGSFELSTLHPSSSYLVTASAAGYGETTVQVQTPAAGLQLDPITITLADPWELQGRVTDSTGLPIPGTKVTLRGTGSDSSLPPVIAVTDELGRFTAPELGSATYRLVAYHADYVTRTIDGITREAYANEGLEIQLHPGATVTGRIRDPGGKAVRSAAIQVHVTDPGTGDPIMETFFAFAGETGDFTIPQVPLGDVLLRIHAAGFEQGEDRFLLTTEGEVVHRSITLNPEADPGG